jgi:lipopolysaccharide transport system ATP-binding protein
VINVEFKFTCSLFPSVYFLNNGVLGVIDEEEVYLHRCVDALMFRVQPETDLLGTSLVDFQVESNLSELKKSNKLRA